MRIFHFSLVGLLILLPVMLFAKDFYKTTTDLRVRTGAGRNFESLFSLKTGDEVELLSKDGDWYRINYRGKTGYVFSKYLILSRTNSIENESTNSNVSMFGILLILLLIGISFIGIGSLFRLFFPKYSNTNYSSQNAERKLVATLQHYGIPSQNIFHDLYFEKIKNHFSQVDVVALTDVGILVFEVKNYSGWIYGTGNSQKWTQVLNYGKTKYRFYNPVLQNKNHIKTIQEKISSTENVPIFSIVVFFGDCELKEIDYIPEHTFIVKSHRIPEVINQIFLNFSSVTYSNKIELINILKRAEENGKNPDKKLQHKNNIKNMLGRHRLFD